jgi:hypothetical protein
MRTVMEKRFIVKADDLFTEILSRERDPRQCKEALTRPRRARTSPRVPSTNTGRKRSLEPGGREEMSFRYGNV